MMKFAQFTHKVGLQIVVAVSCTLCIQANANDDFLLENYQSFGIDQKDFDRMQIIPTRMMENHTLFLAAEAERDSKMSMSQRLINNRWLLNEKENSYSGAEAFRRYLKMYVVQNWKEQRNKQKNEEGLYLPLIKKTSYSQFKDISNYQLRVSDDRVRLRFRYKFD